jgi:thymidylate kinase
VIIVLEGPDKAGKTTLADAFARVLEKEGSVARIHCGPLRRHPLDEYLRQVLESCRRYDHVVCDRLHVGEQIYGPMLRDGSKMSLAEENYIDMGLAAQGAQLIYVLPDEEVLVKRMEEGDTLVNVDQVLEARRRYFDHRSARASVESSLGIWSIEHSDEINVDGFVRHYESVQPPINYANRHPSYVGNGIVSALFVGDQLSVSGRSKGLPTAFAPYGWSSGTFLMEALQDTLAFIDCGLVNSDDHELRRLWELLKHPRMVALGARAVNRLNAAGLPADAFAPHPQWVKRFHNSKKLQYGHALHRLATGELDYVEASYFKER